MNGSCATEMAVMRVIDSISNYFLPIVSIVGVCGNAWTITICMGVKLRKTNTGVYLTLLAIWDTSYLLSYLFSRLLTLIGGHGYVLSCTIGANILTSMSAFSIWTVAFFTVQRYFAIRYPLQVRQVMPVRKCVIFLFMQYLILLTFYIPNGFMLRYDPNSLNVFPCSMDTGRLSMNLVVAFLLTDMLLAFYIPACIVVCLNCKMYWRIRQHRTPTLLQDLIDRRRTTIEAPDGPREEPIEMDNKKAKKMTKRPDRPAERQRTSMSLISNRSNNRSATVTIILISMVYICLNGPLYIASMMSWIPHAFNLQTSMRYDVGANIFSAIAMMIYLFNFATDFILYSVVSEQFRRLARQNRFYVALCNRKNKSQATGGESSHHLEALMKNHPPVELEEANGAADPIAHAD